MSSAKAAPTVRPATKDDVEFVSQDGYLDADSIVRKIQSGDVFVATVDNERIGYLRMEYLWSRLPYVELIRVLAPHRGGGAGRALLAHAEEYAAAQGHPALYSSSQADEPEPQAWHRHMGFMECGFIAGINEGGVGEVIFRKELDLNENGR